MDDLFFILRLTFVERLSRIYVFLKLMNIICPIFSSAFCAFDTQNRILALDTRDLLRGWPRTGP